MDEHIPGGCGDSKCQDWSCPSYHPDNDDIRPSFAPAGPTEPSGFVRDTTKESNPKDALGSMKVPMSIFPASAIAMGSLAFANGALKYGSWNWRVAGVRTSTYLDAALRHLYAFQNGEECDTEDGVPNLSAALACIAIIVEARLCGKLTDDRPPAVNFRALLNELTPTVKSLKEMHKNRTPRHYTIADCACGVRKDQPGHGTVACSTYKLRTPDYNDPKGIK